MNVGLLIKKMVQFGLKLTTIKLVNEQNKVVD